jgi:hypothetical protein
MYSRAQPLYRWAVEAYRAGIKNKGKQDKND